MKSSKKAQSISPPEPMDISPPRRDFLSPISPATPWERQQKDIIFDKPEEQVYKEKSPRLKSMGLAHAPIELELSPVFDSPIRSKSLKPKNKKRSRSTTPIEDKKTLTPQTKSTIKISTKKRTPLKDIGKRQIPKNFKEYLKSKGIEFVGSEVLDFVNEGGNLSKLASNTMICPFIDNGDIKIGTFIAKGSYGSVSNLLFPSDPKKYIVKEAINLSLPPKCDMTTKNFEIQKNGGYGTTKIPKGSLLCKEILSEFYLSVLTGNLLRENVSINFIDTFFFGMCYGKGKPRQYTFMEKINGGDIGDLLGKLTIKETESLYIQILHAIAVYQKHYKLVHSDLHTGNIFVDVPPNKADYLEYHVGKDRIFTSGNYVAKIGDWGMGVKYLGKLVGNSTVIDGDYYSPAPPNFYNTSYDPAFITFLLNYKLQNKSELINKAYKWILNGNKAETIFKIDQPFIGRPYLNVLESKLSHVNPIAILTNPDIMKYHTFVPKGQGMMAGII